MAERAEFLAEPGPADHPGKLRHPELCPPAFIISRDHYRITLFVNNVFDKGYAVGGGNQFGNFGNQLATEILPARDFKRYGGVRVTLSY